METFWGVEGIRLEWPGRGTRPRPWKTTCHGLLSSLHRHGLLSSLHRNGLLSSLHRHGLLSSLHCHGRLSSLHRHGLLSSLHRHGLLISLHSHGLLSSLHRHGLQSSQLRHGLRYLFRSGGPHPVVLSVSVLRGLQSARPPAPVELLRRGTRLPGGGSYVRVLLCVCHVFPPLVSIFGLFPVLVRCDY